MVDWRSGGRRIGGAAAAAAAALAIALEVTTSAAAATAPSDGAPDCWFQTNGREVAAAEGDWYTSKLTAIADHRHLFRIVVPPEAALPVKVRVRDAESKHFFDRPDDADEVLNAFDPTRFTLEHEDPTRPVLARQTFPTNSPDGSVFEATIAVPGTYRLTSETGAFSLSGDATPGLNDDQNAFRIEVFPEGPDLPEPGHEVGIEFTQATITCTRPTTRPLALAYTVPEGAEVTTLRNFDLEVGGDRVTGPLTYTSPLPAGDATLGTMSGEDVWKEDVLPVEGRHGPWTMTLGGLGVNNQVAFEALADGRPLPLSVVSLNHPPRWVSAVETVSEPVGIEPVPVMRAVQLEIDEPDDGQTLRFAVPQAGYCGDGTVPTHPFTRSVAPASGISGAGNETATLRLAVGARDAAGSPHCVRVRVFDGSVAADLELEVDITPQNSAPIARAGPDKVVHEPRTLVTLKGGASFDPDGDLLTLRWAQVRGRTVAAPQTGKRLSFRAPPGKYTFRLVANDGKVNSRRDLVVVRVRNGAPIVTAPARRAVPVGRRARFRLGSFVDPGRDGPWRVKVKWGDRTKATVRKVRRPGRLGKAAHKFVRRGVFTVTVRVTDGDGATGVARFKVAVKRR